MKAICAAPMGSSCLPRRASGHRICGILMCRTSASDSWCRVGWLEPSKPQPLLLMGFAPLNPSYAGGERTPGCRFESTYRGVTIMRTKHALLSTAALALALATSSLGAGAAQAEARLSGQVSGPEGAMEGVLVTAKKNGSTIAYTVVTDAQGRYSFAAGKIEGGEYTLRTRATGFDLDGANRDGALKATVDPQNPTTADLKLKKTHNLAAQLVNAEWMMSMPGTDDQKAQLLNCVGCHRLERIVPSTPNADEFTQVVNRMANYAQVSQPIKPQKRMDPEWAPKPESFRRFAEFLATINLSEHDKWEYALKALPR